MVPFPGDSLSSIEWVNQGVEEGRREGRKEWRHLSDSVVSDGAKSSAPWCIHGEPQTRSTNKWSHLSNTSSTNTHKYVCLMF